MLTKVMMQEIQDLKLRGYTKSQIPGYYEAQGIKPPSAPTISKYYDMDVVPDNPGEKLEKPKAFDVEPFRSVIIEVLRNNEKNNSFLSSYAKQMHEMDPTFPKILHCHVFCHSIGMAMYKAGIPISYIKDFLGHSSIDSTAVYAHADNDAMAGALRSVDQEALPEKDSNGNVISVPEKKWKGKEDYLLHFCGLV